MKNKISILYILYSEKEVGDYFSFSNDIIEIRGIKINPNTFSGFCGSRHNIVYCDYRFMNSGQGRKLVDECFLPLASLTNAQFIFLFEYKNINEYYKGELKNEET